MWPDNNVQNSDNVALLTFWMTAL